VKIFTPIPENYYNYPEKDVQGASLFWGIMAWALPFSLVPFLVFANKNKFIYHHARQGVLLFVVFILSVIFAFIPTIGDIFMLITFGLCFAVAVVGIIIYTRKMIYEFPVIGPIARLIKVSTFDD